MFDSFEPIRGIFQKEKKEKRLLPIASASRKRTDEEKVE
jgi:hypothetical protein